MEAHHAQGGCFFAMLTRRRRPRTSKRLNCLMAAAATFSSAISTKPKPRDFRVLIGYNKSVFHLADALKQLAQFDIVGHIREVRDKKPHDTHLNHPTVHFPKRLVQRTYYGSSGFPRSKGVSSVALRTVTNFRGRASGLCEGDEPTRGSAR